ncbi:hypothetical protein [Nocardioides sp. YIM 152315]|uniref:hypothetical protein n=1 Tax=Nocardioides sp. YIM 152315 TaxID=3031760 RepID=UPI0023DC1838|nr:hypothetical protein [Nocardioides sp. YIM 152315]MDF1603340.1 hypothetical protein [Nocardioides sp. YIM 152315]
MSRRWMNRALIALVVTAVTVPALATSATAAGAAKVPSVDATAKIYPHVGTSSESSSKVYGPGKKCGQQKVVKGASQTSASYSPDYSDPAVVADPSAFEMTGERPSVSATAMKFPNAKAAIAYVHGYDKYTKKCPVTNPGGGGGNGGGQLPDCKSSMKKIAFKLGDERYGYQFRSTCTISGQPSTSVMNTLFVRDGKYVVFANAMSMDATAPSIPKSVEFTRLALRTVS